MAEMLLINPRKRARRASRTTAKRRIVRRKNPIAVSKVSRRRRNPIGLARVARRRRNPITLRGNVIMKEVQAALIGGVGAVAMDVLMGQINGFLPANLQRVPGTIGVGDAVKLALTIAAGQVLSKPTKGMSQKLAAGALICQSRDILASFVPPTMTMGFSSPARIVNGSQRVGPLMSRMSAYIAPTDQTMLSPNNARIFGNDSSPLLNAYSRPGASAMLSRSRSGVRGASQREGVTQYR